MQPTQSINLGLTDNISYVNSTLNAAFTGGTATNCLRWNAAGTIVGSAFITETTTAADGTTVAITDPGVYEMELVGSSVDAVTNIWGLSVGATLVVAGTVTINTNGVFQASQQITILNETRSFALKGYVLLRTAAAKATVALQSTNQFRGVASASGGGAPTGVVAANCSIRINKMNFFSS